jgi:serine/threonine protein kinase
MNHFCISLYNIYDLLCSGYLPPEYIERNIISNKLDIFSLGVIIIKIITGPSGYTQCAEMPSKQFIELVRKLRIVINCLFS